MFEYFDRFAQATDRPVNVVAAIVLIFAALLGGSVVRLGWLLNPSSRSGSWRTRFLSLLTWWALTMLLTAVVLAGRGATVVVLAAVSLIGLWEYYPFVKQHSGTPKHLGLLFLAVPVQFLTAYFGWYGPFWTFVPVWVFFVLVTGLVLTGKTAGFMASAGASFMGMMLLVFLFSHVALVLTLPPEINPSAGPWGLFIYLIALTQGNDISQALWGRMFGRRKIAPRVSPNKTWEGFLLGAATTVFLAGLLADLLTPFAAWPPRSAEMGLNLPYLPALAVGGLIAVGGFFGDLTMSAVKRDVGVKDSSDLLPGQGGVLDRIDSLTFTGPLFFYFTYLLYERGIP